MEEDYSMTGFDTNGDFGGSSGGGGMPVDATNYGGDYGGESTQYDPNSDPNSDAYARSHTPDNPWPQDTSSMPTGIKPMGGGGGGGGNSVAAQLNYQLGMANLAEQMREFNTKDSAQQASAGQAAGGITSLVNEYNTAYAQAVNQYTQDYNKMLGIAQTTSGQQAADIRSQYAQQGSSGMQNLQRLGLGNTTLAPNLQLGVQTGQSSALNRLADQQQQIQLGIIGNRKTNAQLAPDTGLLNTAISAGAGASGSYGGALVGALGGIQAPPQQG
jgi:hypothetical protein